MKSYYQQRKGGFKLHQRVYEKTIKDNKHSDIDENKVIVEKSNTIKFILSFLRASIKTIATIILVSLATIGIITLIYPEIRAEFIEVILNIFNEGKKS